MPKLSLDQEKDAVDFLAECMFSIDFLQSISNAIFSAQKNTITVFQFYDRWFEISLMYFCAHGQIRTD